MAFHATMNRTTTIIINAHAHIRSLCNTYTWTTTMTTKEALIATALLLLLHNKTNESLSFCSLFVSYTLHTLFSVHARDKFLVKVICCCFIYLHFLASIGGLYFNANKCNNCAPNNYDDRKQLKSHLGTKAAIMGERRNRRTNREMTGKK